MGERDESIESVKAAILKELPADPKTTMEFVHSPLGDDIEEWVAVVHVGSDYTTSEGERYTPTPASRSGRLMPPNSAPCRSYWLPSSA
jgi:hypothetical protein